MIHFYNVYCKAKLEYSIHNTQATFPNDSLQYAISLSRRHHPQPKLLLFIVVSTDFFASCEPARSVCTPSPRVRCFHSPQPQSRRAAFFTDFSRIYATRDAGCAPFVGANHAHIPRSHCRQFTTTSPPSNSSSKCFSDHFY